MLPRCTALAAISSLPDVVRLTICAPPPVGHRRSTACDLLLLALETRPPGRRPRFRSCGRRAGEAPGSPGGNKARPQTGRAMRPMPSAWGWHRASAACCAAWQAAHVGPSARPIADYHGGDVVERPLPLLRFASMSDIRLDHGSALLALFKWAAVVPTGAVRAWGR